MTSTAVFGVVSCRIALLCAAMVSCIGVRAATYWANAAASGAAPPRCFAWYEDESFSTAASVTPGTNDGNTYVVMGASKMTSSYTAPAGTTWIFGKDGANVGTSAGRPSVYSNGNISFDFGSPTIYGLRLMPNSSGTVIWKGTTTFVKTSQGIEFMVCNAESAAPRGIDLAGTFIADTDVTVKLSRSGGQVGSTSKLILSGDFTAFKGVFDASASAGTEKFNFLQMNSASAFGDPSVERTDYITLGNNLKWEIAPVVTQYATKGITLALGTDDTNMVNAAEGTAWTLSAPLYGTKGTLSKIGAGTLTLNTGVQIGKIVVSEGTLVLDSAASFAPDTVMTVKSGAQVVSRVGLNIPNVTMTVEEGGGFSFDFTVPYDGETVTTLDMTALPADDWAALAKPVPVQLSRSLPHPLNATNRLAVARFAEALGVRAADFKDASPKVHGLPVTWFELERGEDGTDVLCLVARPVLYLTVSDDASSLGSAPTLLDAVQMKDEEALVTWSDGLAAHAGADYVVANGSTVKTGAGWVSGESRFDFPGESLTLVNGVLVSKHHVNAFKRLVEYDGVSNQADGWTSGDSLNRLEGALELPSGTVFFRGQGNASNRMHFDLAATVTGSAILAFSGDSRALPARFSVDGTDFAGKVHVQMSSGNLLAFSDALSLLADRAVADPRALYIANGGNGFHITENTIFEGVNYGIAFNGVDDVLSVADGKTFALNGNLRLQGKTFVKSGPGVLALGGRILYQYDGAVDPDTPWPGKDGGVLKVQEGWVQPYAWNAAASYRFLRLRFSAGESTGLAVDAASTDADIAKYGMRLEKADAVQFDAGVDVLNVKLLLGAGEGTRLGRSIARPVLTVQDGLAAALDGKIRVVKNFKNGWAAVTSAPAEGLSGYTTFTVSLEPSGMMIIVR